jgi:hypothetical protein
MSQDIVSIENDYIEPMGRWSAIRGGFAKKADAIESSFLTLLRYSALGIAALTLVCAAVILAYGFVQQLGRTKVDPQDVSIDVSDIVPPEAAGGTMSTKPGAPRKVVVGKDVRDKTLQLYRGHFQRFDQNSRQ